MTEKRFRISQGYTDRFCHDWQNNQLLNFRETIELLNEQHETIQRLNQNIDELLSVNVEKELFEENEQLKQAYTQLKHRHSLLHDVCIDAECDRDSYRKDIVSLEEENEQLKKQREELFIRERDTKNDWRELKQENKQLKHSIKCLEADKMELQQYIKRMQGDVE